jgi:hypothetical protein
MAEPLSAIAIATLIATKAFEKTGEKLAEGVWDKITKFIAAIRQKDDATATEIEQAQTAQLSQAQTQELVNKVEVIAASDADIRQAAQSIQMAIQAQLGAIVNLTQLAEKIGVVNQGTIINQTNTFSF